MSKKRTDGEGSIYQRHLPECPAPVERKNSDGKTVTRRPRHDCKGPWVGALVLGYLDSKPVRRRVSANTKSGAATKLRKLREEHEARTLPAGKVPTVEQWMNHWLDNIAARKVAPLTLENSYRQKVRDYIIPLLGQHRLDRLTPDHIEAAWDHLSEVGNPKSEHPAPLAPSTVLQTHRILARAMKVAVQRTKSTGLRENPADSNHMDAPSGSTVEMTPLTVDEAKATIAACAGKRNGARWSVALALGLRQGEALGLPWEHVDLDEGVVRVRQSLQRVKSKGLVIGGLKSEAAKRDIALPAELLALLKAHRKAQNAERLEAGSMWEDHGLVFCQANGRPIDHSRDWKAWRNLLRAAGVPHRRLHDARHSAATMMLLQGVPTRVVMEILGHSQMSVTMKYQHAVDELKREAASRMEAALWG